MRQNKQESHIALHLNSHESTLSLEQQPLKPANLSKSKKLLKKCINEIGSSKHVRTSVHQNNLANGNSNNNERTPPTQQSNNKIKIAAPKPIRARPLGFTQMAGASKWMETSPLKGETSDLGEEQESKISQISDKEISSRQVNFLKVSKLNFQIEQNLSCDDESSKINNGIDFSQYSELKSIADAEQELSEIFSQTKCLGPQFSDFNNQFLNSQCLSARYNNENEQLSKSQSIYHQQQNWSSEKPSSNNFYNPIRENLNASLTSSFQIDQAVGFSKFGHFKAPFKRPSCNPMVKDEKFRRLNNDVNEVPYDNCQQQSILNINALQRTQDTLTDCNSQDVNQLQTSSAQHQYNYNNYNQSHQRKLFCGGSLQNFDSCDYSQNMFAFSQTTSPSGFTSRLQPHRSQMVDFSTLSQPQMLHMNQTMHLNNQNTIKSQDEFDFYQQQQMQLQSQTCYNLQYQFAQMNLSNSAPEYQNSYLNMFSHCSQPLYPLQEDFSIQQYPSFYRGESANSIKATIQDDQSTGYCYSNQQVPISVQPFQFTQSQEFTLVQPSEEVSDQENFPESIERVSAEIDSLPNTKE